MPKNCEKQRRREIRNVNRAIQKLARAYDDFETTCITNGLRVRRVIFKNNPVRESSDMDVIFLNL